MSTHYIFFCGEIKKISLLSGAMYNKKKKKKRRYLGLTKTGLNCGVVLFLCGLNSGILLTRERRNSFSSAGEGFL